MIDTGTDAEARTVESLQIEETRRGFIRVEGNKAHSTEVEYGVSGGLAVFEGDVILGDAATLAATSVTEPLEITIMPDRLPPGVESAVAIVGLGYQWINGRVPYSIDKSLANPDRVRSALEHWQRYTPVRFIPRVDETDYVTFATEHDACYSRVGRVGGQQYVNLGPCCDIGNAIHEIGHVLGLWHEHSRADRNAYVHVEYTNILANSIANFNQHISDSVDIGEYDYDSIMHYPAVSFSKNGKPTIVPLKADLRRIGQRERLSVGDITGVRARLNAAQKITCRNSGKAIELMLDAGDNGAPIVQRQLCESPSQRWRLLDAGRGAFFFSCEATGTVIDLALGERIGPAGAQGWRRNGGPNQQWLIVPVEEHFFRIVSRTTGNVLDVEDGALEDDARIVENAWRGTNSQQWAFSD